MFIFAILAYFHLSNHAIWPIVGFFSLGSVQVSTVRGEVS